MGSWAPSGWGALGGREEHTLQPSRLRAWELGLTHGLLRPAAAAGGLAPALCTQVRGLWPGEASGSVAGAGSCAAVSGKGEC